MPQRLHGLKAIRVRGYLFFLKTNNEKFRKLFFKSNDIKGIVTNWGSGRLAD
jgi:hypothetical protein